MVTISEPVLNVLQQFKEQGVYVLFWINFNEFMPAETSSASDDTGDCTFDNSSEFQGDMEVLDV